MLALTYPDGARVQRCDYLPKKNPAISLENSDLNEILIKTRLNKTDLESIPTSSSKSELNQNSDYASRFKRRLRREEIRRKSKRNLKNIHQVSSTTSPQESCDTLDDNNNNEFIYKFKCKKSRTEEVEQPSTSPRASSQSATGSRIIEADNRLSTFDDNEDNDNERTEHRSYETRRRELPGRESWPGGNHPKDQEKENKKEDNCSNGRCFLQTVLILILIIIGSNKNCGKFISSRVNNNNQATAFGVFTFGTTLFHVKGVCSAPVDVVNDAGVRSERSANLSHITGTSRKIQMYIKHRHLQILPDGTVNGTNDDTSDYTILQRNSVSRGQLRIQGVATCLYLCMDSCGLLYGSREYTGDCVFNETLEQHNYNTYSSAHWSTPRKTLYLGLTGQGQPRRVQAKGHNLGRLSAYARVLTQNVPQDRVEALNRRMLGAKHNVRHHHGAQLQQTAAALCPTAIPQEKDGRDKFRCRKRKKRKKRRRKCRAGEVSGAQCDPRENNGGTSSSSAVETQSKRSCEGAAVEEACRREALDTSAKKRKSRIEDDEDEDAEEDVAVTVTEKKSRRSNGTSGEPRDRGAKKKVGKRTGEKSSNKKLGNRKVGKKNSNNGSKSGKNSSKVLKKKVNHNKNTLGRFVRTTYRLSSSPAITSPISLLHTTSPTFVDKVSMISSEVKIDKTTGSETFSDRPKSSSSSSSAVSAVSLAATSLASTLTLTVASGEVFAQDSVTNGETSRRSHDGVLDFEEFVNVKELNDDDDDEEENDEDENGEVEDDDDKGDFADLRTSRSNDTAEQRLAM